MQSVRTRDTGPELAVRRLLTALGQRYRLNARNLPGKPDIVFPGKRRAIFVHGCFWHGHRCGKGRAPKSRLDYWAPKLQANRERDAAQRKALRALGWKVLTVWQCEVGNAEKMRRKLESFMEGSAAKG